MTNKKGHHLVGTLFSTLIHLIFFVIPNLTSSGYSPWCHCLQASACRSKHHKSAAADCTPAGAEHSSAADCTPAGAEHSSAEAARIPAGAEHRSAEAERIPAGPTRKSSVSEQAWPARLRIASKKMLLKASVGQKVPMKNA